MRTTPAIVFPAYDLMQGDLKVGNPLVAPHTSYRPQGGGGSTLYLPLPYAKHCKVTFQEKQPGSPRYYQINYRTYPAGTAVETFTMAALEASRPTIEHVGNIAAVADGLRRGQDGRDTSGDRARQASLGRSARRIGCDPRLGNSRDAREQTGAGPGAAVYRAGDRVRRPADRLVPGGRLLRQRRGRPARGKLVSHRR